MLRILIVSPNYPPNSFTCGVGDYTRHIASRLGERGHEVDVLASNRYAGEGVPAKGVRVIRFTTFWGLRAGLKLVRLSLARNYSLINLQSTPSLYATSFRLVLPLVNLFTPVLVSFHTLFGGTNISRFEFLFMILFCRGFISTNEEVSSIFRKLPVYRHRFREIPIATNIIPPVGMFGSRKSLRDDLGLPPHTCVVSNFGLFYPGKGLSTLIQCCGILNKDGFDYLLMLLGSLRKEDDAYIGTIRTLIDTLNLSHRVRLYNEQSDYDTSRHLIASDIYVVPYDQGASIRRGTLLAGYAHGLPVITTIPAVPSRYITDENTILVQPRSPAGLAAAIRRVYADAATRTRLSQNAQSLNAAFSWERIVNSIECEFSRLTGRNS